MSHAQAIRTNYKVLLRCTTVNFYVVNSLRADDIIDEEQESVLIAEINLRKQRTILFQWLTEVPCDRYESFLKVMKDTEQEHVANLLRGSTCESKLPLSEARYERLEKIRPKLVKTIQIDTEVLAELRMLRAISDTDVDELRAENVEYVKSSKLINAIMRRSNHSYDCFKEVLRKTLQKPATEYLSEGEMPAVHLNNNRPDLDEPLFLVFNDIIRNRTTNDTEIMNLLSDLNGLDLNPVRDIPGQSIIIFIYCKKIVNAIKFTQLFNSGRLQEILGMIFNRLLLTIEPHSTEELDSHIKLEDGDIISLQEFTGIKGCVTEESQYRPYNSEELCRRDVTTQTDEQAIAKSFTASSENKPASKNQLKELRPLPGFIDLTTEPDMITLDDDPNTMRAKMPCGHVIGPESMRDYFRDIVNNVKLSIICPAHKCKYVWEYFLVRHVACFSDEETQELERKQERNFLQSQTGNNMCPGCKTWCMRVDGAGNRVRCPICTANRGKKFDFCWLCLNEWKCSLSSGHCGNHGCDGRGKRIEILAKCATNTIDYYYDCPSIRGCPKCGILIEHNDKCGHVNCSICHLGFCFICLKEKKDGEDWPCSPYFNTCKLAPRQTALPGSE